MRITVLLIFISLSLLGTHGLKGQGLPSCSCDYPGGEILFCDNFEAYQAGIDLPSQSEDWAGNLGLPTRKRAAGGLQSLSIADQDALPDTARATLGSYTAGRYRLSWKLFYGNTDKGVFFFRPNGEKSRAANWMYFEDGTGNFFLSPGFWGGASDLPTGQWNEFVQLIDLEQNLMELWVNGAMICRSSFYSQAFDVFPGLFIGLLEFQKTAPGGFFVDDVCLSRLTCLPEETSSEFSCPLLVSDQSFDHPAAATCAGYTYKEWTVEAFAGFREGRDWTTDGLRVRVFDEAAGILEVATPSIDSLFFSPEDILPQDCYAGGRVEVEGPTFTGTTDCDSLFQVSWIIFDGDIPIDRYDLEVQVKQFSNLEVESFIVFGQSAQPGDTLRLFDCFEEIPFDMTALGSCSPDTDSVVLRLLSRRRLFSHARSAAPTEEACSLYELLFSPSQPGCCDGRDFSLFIEVFDQVLPGLTAPPDTAISHLDQLEDPGLRGAGAAVADRCGITGISFTDDLTPAAGCPGFVRRIWTATDSCGNTSSAEQRIFIIDTIPPSFLPPPTAFVGSPAGLADTSLTGTVRGVRDNFFVLDTTYEDRLLDTGDNCAPQYQRTWSVSDACGNTAFAIQLISIKDTIPPSFTTPPSFQVSCAKTSVDPEFTGQIEDAADNAGIQTISFEDRRILVDDCTELIRRTWTVTDSCGNAREAIQDIIVQDTTPPELILAPSRVVDCLEKALQPAFDQDVLMLHDNCRITDTSFTQQIEHHAPCESTVFRTWTVTDRCGNTDSGSVRIIVRDTVNPSFLTPPDITVHSRFLSDLAVTGQVNTSADNCGIAAIKFSDSTVRPATCSIPGLVQRAWTVEDYCGNITRDTQMITVWAGQFVAEAGPDKILDCQYPAVRLEGEIVDGMEGLVITWSTENGHIREGDSTLTPTVDQAGLYKLLVTGPDNECSAVDSVRVHRREGLQITLAFTDTLVESGRERLPLPAANPGGGTWSGPFLSGNFFDIQAAGPGEYELVYTVQIENGCRDSSRLFITVENTTAVRPGPEAPTLRIFPNPGKDWFVLEMNRLSGDPVLITLFDVQGQKVLTRRFDPLSPGLRETIVVRDLPPGIYLFSVRERQFHFWRRLIFH